VKISLILTEIITEVRIIKELWINYHWCSWGYSQQNNRCEKVSYTSVNFSKNKLLPHELIPKVRIMNSHWWRPRLYLSSFLFFFRSLC